MTRTLWSTVTCGEKNLSGVTHPNHNQLLSSNQGQNSRQEPDTETTKKCCILACSLAHS